LGQKGTSEEALPIGFLHKVESMNPKKSLENWIRGWLPKEPALPSHQRIKATRDKNRKGVRTVAVISVGVVATALFLVVAFPNPPRPLKQNLYQKTFTDYPYELVSLDVIILYETEDDGTWSAYRLNTWPAGGSPTAGYNITVLIKMNYVSESIISNLNVIDWQLGADSPIADGPTEGHYYPAQAAPLDWGASLMGFWSNRSTWRAVSTLCYPNIFDYSGVRESSNINYHFTIREIQTNGTRYIFGADDIILVPVSG
jgi:hypothetical protein